jgi:predicted ATPase
LDEGLALSEERDERSLVAELYPPQARIAPGRDDDPAAAEACFHTAIQTARRQQSKAEELRATMSLARLWQRQDRRAEARHSLAAIYGTYTEGFTTPDRTDAEAMIKGDAE